MAEVIARESFDTGVEVLAQRGVRSRILWWQAEAIYFGWVDTTVLQAPPMPGGLSGASSGASGLFGPPPPPGTRCPMDVPLFAEVAGSKSEVGAIEKGTRFDVLEQLGDAARVRLRSNRIELEDNARWLVPAALLIDCGKQ